jgi:hypothetical protein
MPRYPSDLRIEYRHRVAYHRAQALSRNREYARDLAELQGKGYVFGDEGVEKLGTWEELAARARDVRRRAGLRRLLTPERLRSLTMEELGQSFAPSVFVDMLGWETRRVVGPVPGAWKVPDLTVDPVLGSGMRWYARVPVPARRLTTRHRDVTGKQAPPQDLYSSYWQERRRAAAPRPWSG